MSFLTRWFRKRKSEDYETILYGLAADVQKRQTRLAEIRLRERRTTLQFTLGTFFLWFAYVSLWYTRTLPSTWHDSTFGTAGMVVGPVLILFARRMMQIWYSWKGNREGSSRPFLLDSSFIPVTHPLRSEKTLKEVLKKQRDTVEEIKAKTNYYNTRNLIEKYDEPLSISPGATPLRRRNVPLPSVPQTPIVPQPPPLVPQQQLLQTPNGQVPGSMLQLSRQYLNLYKQHVNTGTTSLQMRSWVMMTTNLRLSLLHCYALICQKCFAHNGLVKENVWEDTQYVCPKCGFFNPSARSKKRAAQRTPSPPSMRHLSPDRVPQQLLSTSYLEIETTSSGAKDVKGDDPTQMDIE
ncbi:hypothetical protein JVT61DRAFT_6048 [Boletus reticuloceps]|uniref:Endoplasmic reticulum junction formation protein lunapark n=1 Tax=Boletus reticuloceps TaxID=495285 RepID=A0A8I3A8V6_9AGAM|nr:hypothetical protein JVT61DRAFT_6048 [Boletus reticuloceps]